jgi:hypothetical protein
VNSNPFSLLILILLILSPAAVAQPDGTALSPTDPVGKTTPVPFTITLFIPSSNMIHSDQVLDQINTLDGKGVLFGTSFGLSEYNGTWSTRHINRDNISEGLMDEYITSIEFDYEGDLWIGYSGGIQIYNGIFYQTLRDQQLFKDPRIQDLQRWHDDMWVATGNAGLHRFRNGAWTWFQPMTKNGPEFYEVREMVMDTHSDSLLLATADNGLWIVKSPDDPVVFEQIAPKRGTYGQMTHVKRDPMGGVYFFNDTTVVHYSPDAGFVPVLTARDLTFADIEINDLSVDRYGTIYIATDDAIFIWKNDQVYRRLSRFEGIGTSEVVRTVTVDSQNRVWFSTAGHVGYYHEEPDGQSPILVETTVPEITPDLPVFTPTPPPVETPAVITDEDAGSRTGGLAPVLDPIIHAIQAILAKLGIVV